MRATIAGAGLAVTIASGPAWRARELGHSALSGWDSSQTVVVRSPGAFRAAWLKLYPVAALRPALPLVDFSRWRVMFIAAGAKPTGGYTLSLNGGRLAGDSALIDVALRTPPPGCGVIEQLTTPAVAIATPTAPAAFRIILHERADTARCH
jgi:hypothetical protein